MPLEMSQEEFLALGIEVQQEGFQVLDQNLQKIEQNVQSVAESVQSLNAVADEPLDKLTSKFKTTDKQIQQASESLDKLRKGLGDMPDFGAEGGSGAGFGVSALSGLRGTGRALNQLGLGDVGRPLQELGDIGIITRDINQFGQAIGLIPPAAEAATGGIGAMTLAFGPLVAVMAPIALIVLDVKLALDAMQKSAEQAVAASKAQFEEEQRQDQLRKQNRADVRTKSSEQNKQDIEDTFEDAESTGKRIAAKRAEIAANNAAYSNLGASFNPAERNRLGAVGQELQKQLDELIKQQNKEFETNQNMVKVLDPLIEKREAEKKAANDLLQSADDIKTQREKEYSLTQLTSEAAKGRLNELANEQKAITEARDKLKQSGDTSAEVQKKIEEYNGALRKNADEQKYLNDTAIPLIKTREDEAEAIKRTQKAFEDQQKAIDSIAKAQGDYTKAVADADQQLNNQIETAKFREGQAEKQAGPGSMEDIQAREKIRLDESRREIELAQETANQLVDIRKKEGQAEAQIQLDLSRQLADDVTSANDQLSKLQRDAQRTQETDAVDHANRLAEIRDQSQQDELNDIASRDFAKLAQDQQNEKRSESKEDQKYTQQEQRLSIHLQQQEEDLAISLARQEEQQRLAAERRIEDLGLNLDMEIQQINIDEQRKQEALRQSSQYQLDDLTTAENYKIQMLRAGLDNEIALYQMAEQQRLEIAAKTQAAIIAQAMQQIAQIGLSHPEVIATDILQGIMGLFQQ